MSDKARGVTLSAYKETLVGPLRQATLCYLVKGDQVWLGWKKEGFGRSQWNGAGGKPEPGETLEQACVREVQEEFGVTPKSLTRLATLDFFFPYAPPEANWNQQVCVFIVTDWDPPTPTESEEMFPEKFLIDQLPFDHMWPDDKYWLHLALSGQPFKAEFMFDQQNQIIGQSIQIGKY